MALQSGLEKAGRFFRFCKVPLKMESAKPYIRRRGNGGIWKKAVFVI
jgi:hypothetical protein